VIRLQPGSDTSHGENADGKEKDGADNDPEGGRVVVRQRNCDVHAQQSRDQRARQQQDGGQGETFMMSVVR